MSALGQKRTFGEDETMSALPPKADMDQDGRDVRFVPIADIGTKNVRRLGSQGKIRRVGKPPTEHAS
jgi:hypothetical protein